jgi:AcrR family transcriptional regulator
MQREDRNHQLLQTASKIVKEEGTDALSLGYLAQKAGVTKPLVYGHFGTREGLLAALYQEFDARQVDVMDAALAKSDATLESKAAVIASSYIDCVLLQGQEMPDVISALAGSPEMSAVKRAYQTSFIERCRLILSPFAVSGSVSLPGLWAMLGAADAVSNAAAAGDISIDEAKDELYRIIVSMVEHPHKRSPPLAP